MARPKAPSKGELERCFAGGEGMRPEDFRRCIDRHTGSGGVRVSVGPATNLAGLDAFADFARSFLDQAGAD